MQRTTRNVLVVLAAATMLVAGTATTAQAAVPTFIRETVTCQDIGGGTWCQGTATGSQWWSTKCISNYYHPTQRHSSTAMMGGNTQRGVAEAGEWSYATTEAGTAHTCYTKYNPDA
ncbi:lactococcin 972 family bacteriocin [Glycomyces sp. YM15]|uniref:lactococcin 972 family bacteriocin n=1 Tax=Glycomyces sp. YM15 TaxID=2800446 RepID=UPI001964ACA2|nr:lactococcin 972 family bacteriocin [Glycomyces sp. YM15]